MIPLLLSFACNPDADGDGLSRSEEEEWGTDPTKADSDGDGLSDGEEVLDHGTDPTQADSDGDGYSDGEEVEAGSDPNDGFQWPEGAGNWPDFSDEAAAAGITGTGWGMGDQIPDIGLIDQFDQPLQLYQYYGFVILLDVSAGWCNPCNAVAAHAEETYQTYRDDGFVMIHIMLDGWEQETPADMVFLQEWAETHGLTFPLTSQAGQDEDPHYAVNQLRSAGTLVGGIPNFILLDRDLRIDFTHAGAPDDPVLERVAELMSEGE